MHRFRPYFEFPKAASNLGFDPYLLIGKNIGCLVFHDMLYKCRILLTK